MTSKEAEQTHILLELQMQHRQTTNTQELHSEKIRHL